MFVEFYVKNQREKPKIKMFESYTTYINENIKYSKQFLLTC